MYRCHKCGSYLHWDPQPYFDGDGLERMLFVCDSCGNSFSKVLKDVMYGKDDNLSSFDKKGIVWSNGIIFKKMKEKV